jgi:hypothetical protein
MSTEPPTTSESQPTTDGPTEIAARGRSDPWAVTDDPARLGLASARAPRQFDPYSVSRMRNLVDEENAYCN